MRLQDRLVALVLPSLPNTSISATSGVLHWEDFDAIRRATERYASIKPRTLTRPDVLGPMHTECIRERTQIRK